LRKWVELLAMKLLVRTNDAVLISKIEAVLAEKGLDYLVADQHMSVLEGSAGFLTRRILVADDDIAAARRTLTEAGLARELADD
jgi:hypothetical protein